MDLRYSEEYEKFRQAARAFLADNWPPPDDGGELASRKRAARFRERAIECGYLARAYALALQREGKAPAGALTSDFHIECRRKIAASCRA